MPDLHPDHILLLSLAEQAFRARDARELWRTNTRRAAADHGAACEALWDELGRQVAIHDGRVPTLEHPTVTYRRKVAEWRREIVTRAQNAVIEALDALQDGPPIEDETWLPNAEDED